MLHVRRLAASRSNIAVSIFCSCCWAPAPRQLFKISFKLLPSTLPGLCWTCCFLVCELVNFCSPADEVVVATASTQKRFKRPRSQRLPRGDRECAGETSHIMDTQSLCRHLNIIHMQWAQHRQPLETPHVATWAEGRALETRSHRMRRQGHGVYRSFGVNRQHLWDFKGKLNQHNLGNLW